MPVMAVLPVRAWRDSRLHSASENSGPTRRAALVLRTGAVGGLGTLWELVRRLCAFYPLAEGRHYSTIRSVLDLE